MIDLDAIRARRAAITTAKRRVQRYPHLGLDPDTKQPIGERWTVVYEVNDPIWREPHLYIDGLAVSHADATFDAAAPADIDALLAEVERLQAENAWLHSIVAVTRGYKADAGEYPPRSEPWRGMTLNVREPKPPPED